MRKGVSLITLTIYIVGFITIIGILIAFNVNVLSKTGDFVVKNTLNTEYIKFNMFLTAIIKENNYAEKTIDENGNNIIKIIKNTREVENEYARDEETGEQYISGKHWNNASIEQDGYIFFDEANHCIKYIKYDDVNGTYDKENPILMSDYVKSINLNVNDNEIIITGLEYLANETSVIPNDKTYIMGRGY